MRSPRLVLITLAFLVPIVFFRAAPNVQAAGTLSASQCHNDCQKIINDALAGGGTVHLNPGTYVISGKILIPSNTILEGTKGSIIKLIDNANWPKDQHGGMIQGKSSGVNNVRITGFEIDGNRSNNTVSNGMETACGKYFYTMIDFTDASNIEVDHMYLHDNWNDILKISHVTNASFHDNTVRNPGHDIVYATYCNNVKCYNNYVLIYCNSAFRSYSSKNMQVYDNVIGDESSSGWVGIEVQGTPAVLINNNKFTINGGGNSNISGPTAVDSSLKASHNPEYPTTDSTGKSILEGNDTSSGSTGGNSGSDGTGSGSGNGDTDSGSDSGGSGTNHESATPVYPYSPDSIIPEIKIANVALAADTPDEEKDVTPTIPKPSEDIPGTAKDACTVKENSAGLIPCGKNLNDPATNWNECDECGLCSLILMGELVINFLLKMAAIAAVLAIIVSGLIYIFAAGKEKTVSDAKSMLKYTLLGFVVIFTSWMIVDSILTTFGYIDPVEGEWYTICGSSSENSGQ